MRWAYYLEETCSESFSKWRILFKGEKLPFYLFGNILEFWWQAASSGKTSLYVFLFSLPRKIVSYNHSVITIMQPNNTVLEWARGCAFSQCFHYERLSWFVCFVLCLLLKRRNCWIAIYEKHFFETFIGIQLRKEFYATASNVGDCVMSLHWKRLDMLWCA